MGRSRIRGQCGFLVCAFLLFVGTIHVAADIPQLKEFVDRIRWGADATKLVVTFFDNVDPSALTMTVEGKNCKTIVPDSSTQITCELPHVKPYSGEYVIEIEMTLKDANVTPRSYRTFLTRKMALRGDSVECNPPNGYRECGPQFFVVGPYKAASTSIFAYISKHPNVVPSFTTIARGTLSKKEKHVERPKHNPNHNPGEDRPKAPRLKGNFTDGVWNRPKNSHGKQHKQKQGPLLQTKMIVDSIKRVKNFFLDMMDGLRDRFALSQVHRGNRPANGIPNRNKYKNGVKDKKPTGQKAPFKFRPRKRNSTLISNEIFLEVGQKEMHYFDRIGSRAPGNFDSYMNRFPRIYPGEPFMMGDGTPSYVYVPKVAEYIKSYFPKAKIIIMLREPLSRAYSQFCHKKSLVMVKSGIMDRVNDTKPNTFELLDEERIEFLNRFALLLSKEKESLEVCLEKYTKWSKLHQCAISAPVENKRDPVVSLSDRTMLSHSLYYYQVKHWLDHFPKENIMFIRTEDLATKAEAKMKEVTSFLGLPPISWEKITKIKYNVGVLIDGIATGRISGSYGVIPTTLDLHLKCPPLPSRIIKEYRSFFAPHNEKLEKLLGTSLWAY